MIEKSSSPPGGGNLTQQTTEALRAKIASGPMKTGDRLPTEKELEAEFGVSRTVIREAIAVLKADGLVEPRRGAGIFVRDPAGTRGNKLPSFAPSDVHEALDLLELRMAVEIEAAGLAATRRTLSQDARIRECLTQFEHAIEAGASAVEKDAAFHLAIAQGTNNSLFTSFLEALGSNAIPRSRLSEEDRARLIDKSYLERVNKEHRAIVEAISAGDADAARIAMRDHLSGSITRYRKSLSA
ncbi:FadR family transcriptional regulator [Nisaea acidiphila]|uniref:FadR family transcriptional regulator n=1 Tax=Nisaea acidiphila TaxID=1862145 RepID=A0A9J7AXL3_9PROT|nr:FadR/GntR family transcriptional regulator [Nisaea acidiphila]UUX50157.1 FadR family transcriptional regulator [Nisaea acidiphila]